MAAEAKTPRNPSPGRRPARSRSSLSREQIVAHQRQRLMDAMIDLIGRQGYASTTLSEVLTQAVVSHKVFYEHFANKQECFIAAYDTIVAEGVERVASAYRGADGLLESPSAGLEALFERMIENPHISRLVLIEIRAIGSAGIERREQLVGAYERLVRGGLDLPAGRGAIPNPLARAVVGGLLNVLHMRTQGSAPQLRALLPELVSWSTSYYPAPAAVKAALHDPPSSPPYAGLVGGRAPGTLCPGRDKRVLLRSLGVSRSFVVHSERERILDAVANLTAAQGYATLKVGDIAKEAGVSMRTFYEQFAGKEDAFLVAHEVGHCKSLAITERAYASAPDWATGVREGIAALLDFLATEPAFAHMALTDALIATSRSAQRSNLAVRAIAQLFVSGPKAASANSALVLVALDALAGGIFELCLSYAVQGHIGELSELLPVATYFALAPFIGIEEAGRVATEPVAARLQRC
jgi:AcrR family transcriptional regulator